MGANRPGAFAFFCGLGLLVLGLAVSLAFGVILGGPLVLGALALVVRGLTESGRKAAGHPCAGCGRKILFEHEAEFCERCNLAVHAACGARHVASAHKLVEGQPFR